ncbi:MAG: hypothetical protein R3A13_00005, partial [Bdellovibrionota bacterium]
LHKSVMLGIAINTKLENSGLNVIRQVLIDDTRFGKEWGDRYGSKGMVDARTLGVTQQQIQDTGFKNYESQRESWSVDLGIRLAKILLKKAQRHPDWEVSKDGSSITRIKNNERLTIKLKGKDGDANYPSCEILDLSNYLVRAKETTYITILPKHYSSQQKRVQALAELLGFSLLVINIFFDEQGEVSKVRHWTPQKTNSIVSNLF